jgi:hypothetical protein
MKDESTSIFTIFGDPEAITISLSISHTSFIFASLRSSKSLFEHIHKPIDLPVLRAPSWMLNLVIERTTAVS